MKTNEEMVQELYQKFCDELDVEHIIKTVKELKLFDLNYLAERDKIEEYYNQIFNNKQ